VILPPLLPTYTRYRKLSAGSYTLLRELQYEAIAGRKLTGRVLDIGGGRDFDYYKLFQIEGKLETINAAAQTHPTYVGDLNDRLPMAGGTYDWVISLNTFEHLRLDQHALQEMLRGLKPGGRFLIMVPFLHFVHGRYGDYHRHTDQWWHDYFREQNCPEVALRIEPLVWDKWTTAACIAHGMRRPIVKQLLLLPGVLKFGRVRNAERHSARTSAAVAPYALSYLIEGQKGSLPSNESRSNCSR